MTNPTPESLPYKTITPNAARMIYSFQMSGQIARLFLYLFGEFDKETVAATTRMLLSEGRVVEVIISRQQPPLRAIYDELVVKGLIEAQDLTAEAQLYIDLPDNLQARIVEQSTNQPTSTSDDHSSSVSLVGEVQKLHSSEEDQS